MDMLRILVAAFVGLSLLIVLLAAFWFWRRRAAKKEKASVAKEPSKKPTRPVVKDAVRRAEKIEQPSRPAPPVAAAVAPPLPAKPTPPPAPPKPPAAGSQYDREDFKEKIRILIVDDNPETRENVSRLLYFEKDMEVIGQARNGRQGLEMAAELKPHIVLMDINMPDMDGITATQQMAVKAPYSQVIVMSVQAEQHYMRQAMAAGARDFQPKPFTADELNNCIRRVYNIGLPVYRQLDRVEQIKTEKAVQPKAAVVQGDKDALVIVVYSPKGGMGTSTFAANLAVALQQEYGDAVLMDADLQFGDIMVHLNTRATRNISDLIYEGDFDIELLPDVLLPHSSGLKLLLAPARPELADAILPEMLVEVIKTLKQQYKIVVVDTDSHLGDKTMRVIEAADHILVISAPELPAVKNTKLFLEVAGLLGFGPDRLTVVLNRVGIPGGVSSEKIEQVLKLEHTYRIPYDSRIHIAINKGVAVTQQDAMAPSAQAIVHIARELGQRLAPEPRPTPVKEKEAA